MTAAYGLRELAHMSAGDRVLIHAAAGGVGLAAVQLAQLAGAEVVRDRWQPGQARLSRIDWGQAHSELALASVCRRGDGAHQRRGRRHRAQFARRRIYRAQSVSAPFGRPVPGAGKNAVWTPERVAERRPDVAYHAIYLGGDGEAVRSIFPGLLEEFASGNLQPLPFHTFQLRDAISAFRFMAQAKHLGKIVLVHDAHARQQRAIRPDGTYLITGGTGALGLQVARLLAQRGARNLVLASRHAGSQTAAAAIADLEREGVRAIPFATDLSSASGVDRLLAMIADDLPPLRGVVHAAGAIADGVLLQQDRAQFERVLGPKASGAWQVHEGTKHLALDFFVEFSSIASVFGAQGQANYAAANAVLDAIAHHRRGAGLPGTSINWGGWAGAGMTSTLEAREVRRREKSGVALMEPELALAALDRLPLADSAQVVVMPIDWRAAARQQQPGTEASFTLDLLRSAVLRPGRRPPPRTSERQSPRRCRPSDGRSC